MSHRITAKELPSYVGKDVTEQLTKNSRVTGDDLEVGGKGMEGFYDKMLPDYMGRLGKKYGVKPKKIEMDLGYTEISSPKVQIEIENFRQNEYDSAADEVADMTDDEIKAALANGASTGETFDRVFSRSAASRLMRDRYLDIRINDIDRMKNREIYNQLIGMCMLEPERDVVWSMDITPAMRKDILEKGQPTFAGVPALPLIGRNRDKEKK